MGERAEYGRNLLAYLSERLTEEFGKGFTERNLRAMRQFYDTFPIRHTLRAELSWSHYRLLMRVEEPNRRKFYLIECADNSWTVRQLERQELFEPNGLRCFSRSLSDAGNTCQQHRPNDTT